ncbi:LuxR C-terminal-related transcriptional regulator [Streptomyces sp. V4-01]|uniref:LuxR C-terminal-related transcriptional regulator n=1 Tax=Actinacidiphila polyblastidii TaxID=3110430 RepID=A0ABU7PL21_9ACTN|nr:LuxR C-terminal-related transcriptional regulator [Streptomyces sp. V4-01]
MTSESRHGGNGARGAHETHETHGAHDARGGTVRPQAGPPPPDVIEQFTGRQRCSDALRDNMSTLRVSADNLHRAAVPAGSAALAMGSELVQRGVRVRVMYPRAVLSTPEHVDYLGALTDAGVLVGLVDTIAHDMMIFDGHTVCLPAGRPSSTMLRISRSMLVRSLASIYETYWERATPFDGVRLPTPRAALDLRELAVTQLMTQGHDDASIAERLGVDRATVAGVAEALMDRLGAASRFELGFKLARQLAPGDGAHEWDLLIGLDGPQRR